MEKNELTNTIHTTLCPRAVLIAYTYAQDRQYFLEQRSIDAKGRMGEGHPVTVEFMNELVRNYSETYSGMPYGSLPSNLLYADTRKGSERYIWYNPPGKRMMYFVGNLGIENAEYNLPGVIYEAGEHGMNIYAYKDKELKEDSALYAAPFFNVTRTSVCLGSAKIVRPNDLTYANLLEYWEKKFWLTEFSHLGGNGNPTKSNLVLVTKAARDRDFNLNELKPLNNLKLKDILK